MSISAQVGWQNLPPNYKKNQVSSNIWIVKEDKEIGRLLQLGLIESFLGNRDKLRNTFSHGSGKADRRSKLAMGRLLARLNLASSYAEGVARHLCCSWQFKKGTLDNYLKGVKEGSLAPMTVPTAPETPSSHAQPDVVLGEESDDSLAMSEEEDGDDGIVPSIESPFPTPREAPRVNQILRPKGPEVVGDCNWDATISSICIFQSQHMTAYNSTLKRILYYRQNSYAACGFLEQKPVPSKATSRVCSFSSIALSD